MPVVSTRELSLLSEITTGKNTEYVLCSTMCEAELYM